MEIPFIEGFAPPSLPYTGRGGDAFVYLWWKNG